MHRYSISGVCVFHVSARMYTYVYRYMRAYKQGMWPFCALPRTELKEKERKSGIHTKQYDRAEGDIKMST